MKKIWLLLLLTAIISPYSFVDMAETTYEIEYLSEIPTDAANSHLSGGNTYFLKRDFSVYQRIDKSEIILPVLWLNSFIPIIRTHAFILTIKYQATLYKYLP
uniref:Uncharacterized protein n=1 Tax=Anaerobacillus isosaccharinicus TaxID=1532552 RepID=A0A1S2L8B9_9BACI